MDKGFGQFCPVAVACEIFAARWTPMVLRELLAGSHHFNEIHRGLPAMSRALLARRLRELEAAGIVRRNRGPSGKGVSYGLTEAGLEFRSVLEPLGVWGQRWAQRAARHNLDPEFLMWNMRRRIARDALPPRRTVVQLTVRAIPAEHRGFSVFWLVMTSADVDLCVKDPGFEVDLYVDARIDAMVRVWLGDTTWRAAVRDGAVKITGPRELVKAFPSWLLRSHFADVPRVAVE
jgi:DNA-binding HxlR family transcriptional regulator